MENPFAGLIELGKEAIATARNGAMDIGQPQHPETTKERDERQLLPGRSRRKWESLTNECYRSASLIGWRGDAIEQDLKDAKTAFFSLLLWKGDLSALMATPLVCLEHPLEFSDGSKTFLAPSDGRDPRQFVATAYIEVVEERSSRLEFALGKLERYRQVYDGIADGSSSDQKAGSHVDVESSDIPENKEAKQQDSNEDIPEKPTLPLKVPTDNARSAWLLKKFSGTKTQAEIAVIMTKRGIPVDQGTVSKWLKQFDEYIANGGIAPAAPTQATVSGMDPAIIDLGARQDGRAERQRQEKDE